VATAAAFLFVCLAFGLHLVLHEIHGDRHEGAQSAPTGVPEHEHRVVQSSHAGVFPSLTIAAARPVGGGVAVMAAEAPLDIQLRAASDGRFGAIRSGPRPALQSLLSTFLI